MDSINSHLGWLGWIVFGALAGWVASMVAGTNEKQGCLANIVVGIVGAFIGGYGYSLIAGTALDVGWSWTAFGVSVLGAIVLLAIINLFRQKSR